MKRRARVKPLLFRFALAGCGMIAAAPVAAATDYLGPVAVVASKDGKRLFVANADARQIAMVDIASGKVTNSIAVPAEPTGVVLGPRSDKLYVTCAAPQSTVVVLDAASGEAITSIPTGHTAIGPAIAPNGTVLYVCNRFDNAVAVIDLVTNKETTRVPTIREPIAAAITPDGKTLFVANHLPLDRADAYDVATVVTVIDTASKRATSIRLPNGSSSLRDICVSPDGRYAYTVHILARYVISATRIERGWMNTSAMSVIDVAKKKLVNTVLLDDLELGAANPWGVACTADGASICVTHAGTHELSILDAKGLLKKLPPMPDKPFTQLETDAEMRAAGVFNDLSFLVGLRRRVRLQGGHRWEQVDSTKNGGRGKRVYQARDGSHWERVYLTKANGPRGLAVVGSNAYAAAYFSDSLAVVDLEPKSGKVVSKIALGPKPHLTAQRRGQMYFNDATQCFQHWQSCATCHPDARVDALNWDLMSDTPKNTRSMLLAHKTPPATSSGIHASAELTVRSRIRHILGARPPDEDAAAIDAYLKSLVPVPSPYLVDGNLSAAAERGKRLFFDKEVGCSKCHPEPLYTDLSLHDVASKGRHDRRETFDTPTLIECWRTAPYMHDGRYTTLTELFTKGKHGNKGGNVDKLNNSQIDDLVGFVLSL